ncbi:alpha-2-macroglobulin-like protein 1 [Xyrauchen texanus]|uniref:alpha-2-macroglobulin-like protein 1 n=1 Tax=Xyrauchen texanus TaxID=154827 RepID=UPI002241D5F6|nr:alpha-2-macroglobulin-like protein 1 [Xyrauchen texanus]
MRVLGELLTLLLLLQCGLTRGETDPKYLVAVTSQAVGGSTETLCAQIHEPKVPLNLVVTLISDNGEVTILNQQSITRDFYKCVPFKVPSVTTESVANVKVVIQGNTTSILKTTKILIKPPTKLIFIQTDKPIYKPGQTVKFRIVSLDSSFLPHKQVFQTVELQDPNFNRIGQWLNRSTNSGILDLSHRMTPGATQGYYTITIWDEKNQQTSQYFEIKEYVLPKYEVNIHLPPIITILDKEVTLKVCAKYTYGKPVLGSVNAEVCAQTFYRYYFEEPMPEMLVRPRRENLEEPMPEMLVRPTPENLEEPMPEMLVRPTPENLEEPMPEMLVRPRPENLEEPMPEMFDRRVPKITKICKKYSMTTDNTGCGSQVINVTEFGLTFSGYFEVNGKVEEYGTGVILEDTASATFTSEFVRISFEDMPMTYRPGIDIEGKVLVTGPQFSPMKNEQVYVYATYGDKHVNVTVTSDSNGIAYFSFKTTDWSELPVSLEAQLKKDTRQSAYFWLRPFYSKSKSFLMLVKAPGKFSCKTDAVVQANYTIQGNALKPGQKTLAFFYMVLSKGSLAQHGRLSVNLMRGTEKRGNLRIPLKQMATLSPIAQVVVYTILPSGEAVADSMDFPTELCLPNKVSLNFSSPTALPGERTSLKLKAQPGSLCSVRAIDQSVLLLKPEAELNAEFVFNMLPVQTLAGYPYNVEEWEPYICKEDMFRGRRKRSRFYYPYYGSRDDVYNIFKGVGIKIATNSDVKQPINCNWMMTMNKVEGGAPMAVAKSEANMFDGGRVRNPIETIRTYFPETWIWDLVPVGRSGSVDVAKTVPDTITKWAAGAFCTSPIGFGVAPSINLTAFQPFFVSLTLPYSVIRGEVFTLKASVFNYLSKCIMVKVTLANSNKFSAKPCEGCKYTQCVCAGESKTFQWIITPSALGEVKFTVSAETVKTKELCGKEVVTMPERGRIDTVVQKLLVEAEGTKQSVTHNELICLTDRPVETTVSLNLPNVFVKDSEESFVTVLGDLMGRALKNIANLLAMPYGCGEQNMLLFAPNIYILQYLESSGQLTPEIKGKAITFLENGYQRELEYKHVDGSYSAFGNRDASGNTWLTAFVMKSFGGAKKYIFVDEKYISQAKEWLGQQQQKNGCFTSVGKLFHNDMKGGVSDDVTLTAYITAALLELGINKSDPMVEKSLVCLKEASGNLNNTYFTALLSYTFTLAGDAQMRQRLLTNLDQRAKKEGILQYWTNANSAQQPGSLEVEMSAYVLLALLSGPTLPRFGLGYSASIVGWLVKQQNAYGGFSSTQDTVVALQALAMYSAATYSSEGDITVTVTSPTNENYQFTVNQQNRLLYQEKELQPPTGKFKLKAKGKGCVFVQFALHYNIPPPPDTSAFGIKTNVFGVCNNTKNTALTLNITVRYNGKRDETNMVIVNVKLLSGFKLDETSLQTLKQDPTIKRVDLDMGHVFIYLERMKNTETKFFTLKLLQDVPVKQLKPAVVKVYDYYKTSEKSVSEYSSPCA